MDQLETDPPILCHGENRQHQLTRARLRSICTRGIQKSSGKLEDPFRPLEILCYNFSPC